MFFIYLLHQFITKIQSTFFQDNPHLHLLTRSSIKNLKCRLFWTILKSSSKYREFVYQWNPKFRKESRDVNIQVMFV